MVVERWGGGGGSSSERLRGKGCWGVEAEKSEGELHTADLITRA